MRFVRPRFDAYKRASRQIRAIFARHTALIEPLSLDEAYLDVTEACQERKSAGSLAAAIKDLSTPRSASPRRPGVSFNKFLAKIASDLEKPDGLAVDPSGQALAFLAALPIRRFHGIGPATAAADAGTGHRLGADLQARGEHELVQAFGQAGRHYCDMAQARDDRSVEPDRARRSLSVETTFGHDLRGLEALEAALAPLADELAARLERSGFFGRTLTLKLRYGDWDGLTSRRTAPIDRRRILPMASELLRQRPRPDDPVRLLGVGVSNTAEDDRRQLLLPFTGMCSAGHELDGVRLLLAGLG